VLKPVIKAGGSLFGDMFYTNLEGVNPLIHPSILLITQMLEKFKKEENGQH
jgi:hypothetical protein